MKLFLIGNGFDENHGCHTNYLCCQRPPELTTKRPPKKANKKFKRNNQKPSLFTLYFVAGSSALVTLLVNLQ